MNNEKAIKDPRPYVKVVIHGRDFKALIDTGAVVSLINEDVVQHLREVNVEPVEKQYRISMANQSEVMVTDSYEFELEINMEKHIVTMPYLKDLSAQVVIGMDLISLLNLVTLNIEELPRNACCITSSNCEKQQGLSKDQALKLEEFLKEELPKFEACSGRTDLLEHKIKLKDKEPFKLRYYPRNPAMQKIIDDEVDRMLKEGIIRPSHSPYSSPMVLVRKPSGKYRLCLDLRRVNSASEADAYPMPRINAILEKLREANYITTIDLKQGYWQVPLTEESKPLTAFTVPGKGLFEFVVMPFGLHTAGATFQRLLDKVIGPELEPKAFAYLDDLIIVSKTFEEHLVLLEEVFGRLRAANLKLNSEKCHFCRRELKYLGHVVSSDGIKTDPEKVRAITEFPTPKTVRTLRSFIGLASWYRRFIDNFAKLTLPLTKLLRKNARWEWKEAHQEAFERLKERLVSTPVLACPDYNQTFWLQVDASDEGLGAALTQTVDGKEVVIAYASRLLSDGERKFTVTEKECLALVWAVKKFRPYLEGYKFIAVTDHQALKWLMNLQEPSGRLARWILELQQYEFEIRYRKGALNKVADALSRNPVNVTDTQPVDFPTEKDSKNNLDWYTRKMRCVQKKVNNRGDFVVRDGKLYRGFTKKTGIDETVQLRRCVPKNERIAVLKENHDSETAGHLGIRKTTKRVQQRYYWPGMGRDIKRYVQQCLSCQAHKIEQNKPLGKMTFRKPTGPWYTVTADLIGPLPRSKRGSRFLLVTQDVFTKWVEMAPLKAATASNVMNSFRDLVLLRYGAPEVVITDNGSQFTAKIWKDLIKGWDVEHQLTAPYSPQENPVERMNRVIKTMIAQYVNKDHQSWDVHLNEFRYAINTAVHDSTGYTPAMLTIGRELRVPNAIHGPLDELGCPHDSLEASIKNRLKGLAKIREDCHRNIRKAYDRQAKYFNLRRRDPNFKVGDRVWVRQHPLSSAAESFAAKLAAKYDGPYDIVSRFAHNIYSLRDSTGRSHERVHVKDLKRYVT